MTGQTSIPRRANNHSLKRKQASYEGQTGIPLKRKQASPDEHTDFHGRADDYARAVSVISPEGLTSALAGITRVMARMVLG